MTKPSKQGLLALLKLALLGVSFPLVITSFSLVNAGIKPDNSLDYAQATTKSTPQPSQSATPALVKPATPKPGASAESKKKSQPAEEKVEEKSEKSDEEKEPAPSLILTLSVLAVVMGLYLGVLRFRPLWLLWLPAELNLPKTPITPEVKLPVGILRFLKYRPRVLDAWVEKHLETFQKKFLENETVEERKDYVSLPVLLNGKEIDEITAETLSETFKKDKRVRVLIRGEGGSGKTTISCQIAKWAMEKQHKSKRLAEHLMLPVLIEEELDANAGEGIKPLMEAVVGEIQELIDSEQTIVDELLVEQLLRQRRILLIVDHYSEMSQDTQKNINPDLREFPANALIVTSRIDEKFKGIDINIETLRFDGGKLAYFIEQYLKQCGKWDLFEADQEEFLQECAQLARIVGEQKTITVLLAKLYAERMINAKQDSFASGRSLDNIPDLILAHLEKLNCQGERNTKNEYPTVKQDAKVIAWKCLEQSYKPSPVDREVVVKALGSNNAASCLDYFEKHLRLLKSIGYAEERKNRDKIRFALDPLAEYLAALYLVQDHCKDDEKNWRELLAEVEKKSGNLEEIKGFLLAVRDCCLAKGSEVRVPSFVADELGKLAGLDLEALEQERQRQRIKRLRHNLFAPDATVQDRLHYLGEIGESGSVAKFAAPAIVQFLTNDNSSLRLSAAEVLIKLGNASEAVVQSLLALLEDDNSSMRLSAAKALVKLGNASEDVVQSLLALLQDDHWPGRKDTAEALGKLGNASEEVVQSLLALFQDDHWPVRLSAAEALGKLGNASEEVVQGLSALLQDDNSSVRSLTAQALGKLGNTSEAVMQSLLALLQDDDSSVRLSATKALGKLDNASEDVVQSLLALLEDDNSSMRYLAAHALGNLGNASDAVMQSLLALLQDDDWAVRCLTAEALGNLGNASDAVMQSLLALLQDDNSYVRSLTAEALVKLGNASEPVVQSLSALLEDDDSDVREAAAEALGNLGNASDAVMQSLLALLEDDDSSVRYSAAEALIKLGNASKDVVQGLLALVEDDDSDVREAAAQVLAKLGHPSEPVS
ncbi:HEAT repeat domain-containing protein [Microcoleus sp. FACHB-672]|uniref:HEAT repeat domain-containing protein n=1 Tax=Microcoleus sp. FACHB-672 TaxID=2692825 RepID=UPI001684287D|nr:HEAT repeat domain-containing protein [Microcoleus sp. FACHB-672]MBD2043086.1 HEAT repeat domain-containing protein [Microcoleus sp. FACHB-672]